MSRPAGVPCSASRWTGEEREMRLRTREAGKLSFLLATALIAGPAQARRHRPPRPTGPPPARVEDDPRKKGNDRAFAKATISFAAPEDRAQLDPAQAVRIDLKVTGYALGALQPGGPAPHLHLIVDNEPAVEIKSLALPLRLTGLARGPHLLRAVLCRPWHEVVKARHAFAMVRFWVGPKLAGKAGKAAEYVAWPDPKNALASPHAGRRQAGARLLSRQREAGAAWRQGPHRPRPPRAALDDRVEAATSAPGPQWNAQAHHRPAQPARLESEKRSQSDRPRIHRRRPLRAFKPRGLRPEAYPFSTGLPAFAQPSLPSGMMKTLV